jgi:rhodanese-related sulfurtransferase
MRYAQDRLGGLAQQVHWLATDVLAWEPPRRYRVWHDRAVFHFLTSPPGQHRYVRVLDAATETGAVAVFGCFAPDGPDRCSGLPVARYDIPALAAQLGPAWTLHAEDREEHITPAGVMQPFTWAAFRKVPRAAKTADELLAQARAALPHRPSPAEALQAQASGALLIDIREDDQRREDGLIPGAIVLPRNSLEWRCDPASQWRHPAITRRDQRIILICNQGYQSTLAAATLQQLGLIHATDVDGGFTAWAAAGLPVITPGHKRPPPTR